MKFYCYIVNILCCVWLPCPYLILHTQRRCLNSPCNVHCNNLVAVLCPTIFHT